MLIFNVKASFKPAAGQQRPFSTDKKNKFKRVDSKNEERTKRGILVEQQDLLQLGAEETL